MANSCVYRFLCAIIRADARICTRYCAISAPSDNSLLIYFDQQISLTAHQQVAKLLRLLELQPVSGIVNLHPAYCSVLVKFDALKLRHDELESRLRRYLEQLDEVTVPEPRHREIPVCYGGEYGPDLAEVCDAHSLSVQQAIDLHVSATYIVYFLGFVPGFAYLGGLPEALATPRLATPRRTVPAGSVGIAGQQPASIRSPRPVAGD